MTMKMTKAQTIIIQKYGYKLAAEMALTAMLEGANIGERQFARDVRDGLRARNAVIQDRKLKSKVPRAA
jgi:hypothetical protein